MRLNWQLLLVILLIVGVIGVIILINRLSLNNKLTDTTSTLINPVSVAFKKDCQQVRTPCNPKDPNSCNNACTEEQLECVLLDNINPPGGGKINGGGAVCLKGYPKIKCNINHGGVYVWTGYGFADHADWECYCMYPEFFGGPGCQNLNADICTGGTVDLGKMNGMEPTSDICTCPPGSVKMIRGDSGTPYCESNDPNKGGGMFGTAGDIHGSPDWRNVLYRGVSPDVDKKILPKTTAIWAETIVKQLALSYDAKLDSSKALVSIMKNYLDSVDCRTCSNLKDACNDHCVRQFFTNLTRPLANQICQTLGGNAYPSICDSNGNAVWSEAIEKAGKKMWYTYTLPGDFPVNS